MDEQDVPGGDWLMTTRRWEKVMIQVGRMMFETGVRPGGWGEVGSTVIRRLARKVGWLPEDGAAYISAGLGPSCTSCSHLLQSQPKRAHHASPELLQQ